MKLARWPGPDGPVVGYVTDDGAAAVPIAESILDAATAATHDPSWLPNPTAEPVALADVRLLAPVETPGALRDFYAFERHVATARARRGLEMDPAWYRLPVFYFTNPAALIGHDETVCAPPRCDQLDFELEFAWMIDADHAPVGYCVMNDWSARDVQREEMALSLGPAKGKDFATSLGPVLVTADEFDPSSGAMRAWVNGALYSEADLSECHWSVADMTAYAAEATTLRAGDVFGSGTCGTGCILELSMVHGAEQYPWLQPGDVVELEIAGLGTLRNRVGDRQPGPAWGAAESPV